MIVKGYSQTSEPPPNAVSAEYLGCTENLPKKCGVSHQPPNLVKYSAAEIISAKFRRTAAL